MMFIFMVINCSFKIWAVRPILKRYSMQHLFYHVIDDNAFSMEASVHKPFFRFIMPMLSFAGRYSKMIG